MFSTYDEDEANDVAEVWRDGAKNETRHLQRLSNNFKFMLFTNINNILNQISQT